MFAIWTHSIWLCGFSTKIYLLISNQCESVGNVNDIEKSELKLQRYDVRIKVWQLKKEPNMHF